MVEHAGVGGILSLLIVATFAILLHEKETPPQAAKPATVAEKVVQVTPSPAPETAADPRPAPSTEASAGAVNPARLDARPLRPTSQVAQARNVPEIASTSPADPAPRPAVDQVAIRRPESKARARVVPRRVASAEPHAKLATPPSPMPARPAPTRVPKSAFAEVEAGETLGDVAERVYGSRSALGILLRANRDQVHSSEGPLVAGTWLRTP